MRAGIIVAALGAAMLGIVGLSALPLVAQDNAPQSAEAQKDWLTQFVQDRLSTPERQIRLSNINGVLSSDASIDEITIADQQGIWLRVEKAAITWNQTALFGGRLEIQSLSAQSVDYLRNPVPAEGAVDLPAPEAGGIAVPELPVAVILEKLSVPRVTFGESVFGLGSAVSVTGALTLEGGSLDTNLDITRLDGPGGTLGIAVNYAKGSGAVDVALNLAEPPNGIIANLLNIENRPDMRLSLAGKGPISDLVTTLALDAGGQRALSGEARIKQVATGFAVDATLGGPIAALMPAPYRPFFGTQSHFAAQGELRTAGGMRIDRLTLSGGQLALEANAETTKDNFLSALTVTARVADAGGQRVLLPVAGADTTIGSADISIAYGGPAGESWSADIRAADFANPTFSAKALTITGGGAAANLADPANRRLTFNADGLLRGVGASDPDVASALGQELGFGLAGLWSAGQPVRLAQFRLAGKALEASAEGQIDDFVFDGTIGLNTANIAPFSDLAARDLNGALTLAAKGTLSPLIGGFDLAFDGKGTDLRLDDALLDGLLKGEVALSGRLARTETGLSAEQFQLGNERVRLTADGTFATGEADFLFRADLSDLALLSPQASGALSVVGRANGTDGALDLSLNASAPAGTLVGRTLREADVGFTGTLSQGALTGKLAGAAFLDGHRIDLGAGVTSAEGALHLTGLAFEAPGTQVTGDLVRDRDGLLAGRLDLKANDISTAATLALIEAKGAANAAVVLEQANGKQSAGISVAIRGLSAAGMRVGSADVKLSIADLFGVPMVDGSVNGSAIAAAGLDIRTLAATAQRNGETTHFDGNADLANGATLGVTGALTPKGNDGFALALTRADLAQGPLRARLAAPASLALAGDTIALEALRFDVGGGQVSIGGTAGKALAIDIAIANLPLSIANAVMPDLGLAGTLNGKGRITGAAADPRAEFTLEGQGLNATAIAPFGIAPLGLSAAGSFADGAVTLARLSANGASGLSISGSGTVPLAGRGLNLTLEGSAPLSLANRFVADRGGQASGTANLSASVTGSLASPRVTGRVAVQGAQYVDPELNLRLNDITGSAALDGDTIRVERLTANLATGGSLSASGSLNFAAAGLPADIRLDLKSARYADGNMLVATVSGNLALTGPVTQGGLLSGQLLVEKADITIPDSFGGSADVIDVRHVALPKDVAQTLARGKVDERAPRPNARPSALRLDVDVSAPNQIFVRGRGLDAELGGAVRLTGFVNNIVPVGGFTLNRGRLAILGQRITFDSGSVTLVGDLDPTLDFVARSEGEDITVFITVKGPVSALEIGFASTPALPQDEVLSRLLFKRGVGDLSPLQLARLAGAAAELAGGSNGSLVDSLRDAAGLSDLELMTDETGNAAVRAGSYLQDNIYLGVQAGANGKSKVTIDLDITSDIKARGSASSDGETGFGVFYEKDY